MAVPPNAGFVAAEFGLGPVVDPPAYVARGELGDVWRMATSTGEWAVKRLRQSVDSTAGHDLELQLAVLAAGTVRLPRPLVVTSSGNPILVEPTTGAGYRVYEWVDHLPDVTVDPATAGGVLARIHAVDVPAGSIDPWFWEPEWDEADWRLSVRRVRDAAVPWSGQLERRLGAVLDTVAATPGTPPERLTRCHLDFGADNVLVDRSGRPWVIDWENSGGGDPDQELSQAAVAFGDTAAFLAGYRAAAGPARLRSLDDFAMTFAVQANFLAFCIRDVLAGGPDAARRSATAERLLRDLVTVDAAHQILATEGI